MRMLGMWSPVHFAAQTALTTTLSPPVTGRWDNPITNYSLFSSPAMTMGYWSWNVVNTLGRYWLRVQSQVTTSYTTAINLGPVPDNSAYQALLAAGHTRAYHAVRIYVAACKTGATLLSVNSIASYAVTAGSEYFVEVVDNLETKTRTVYVNGSVASSNVTAGGVQVGNINGSLSSGSAHQFYMADYYYAVSDANDPSPPLRLGKMSIKVATPSGAANDSKFTPSVAKSIATILGSTRTGIGAINTTEYVTSDSNGSKMDLLFTAPNRGDKVVGAQLNVVAMRDPVAQALAKVAINGSVDNIGLALSTNPNITAPQPFTLPTPEAGWSEAELGNYSIKLYSERSV